MAKMGRPRKEISVDEFKKLCYIQCTLEEMAGWFDCCNDTLESWCVRELGMTFSEAYKTYSAGGRISVRRSQFKMAETNPTMAIWLGKQYLGQTDKQTVRVTENDSGVQEMNDYFSRKRY